LRSRPEAPYVDDFCAPGLRLHPQSCEVSVSWTKPEAEVVAVTMEVTAYVATL
jgi:coenzyme PQQ precursor peptide PqqA